MSDETDDEVGYGKPPKHTRFKPGQSGNPRGRPKSSPNLRALLIREVTEPVRITVNGRSERAPALIVALKQVVAKAIKGDLKATGKLIELIESHVPELLAPQLKAALSENEQQLFDRFIARQSNGGET